MTFFGQEYLLENWRFISVQAIGLVGFSLYALSFQLLSPRRTILLQSLANFLIGFHFGGLGYGMPTLIAFLASLRDLGSALTIRRVQVMLLGLCLAALYVGAWFFAESWVDVFAIVGSTLAAGAQFFRGRFYIYRFCSFFHQGFWLIVYVMMLSIPGIIFMGCILASNIIGIVRYYWKKAN